MSEIEVDENGKSERLCFVIKEEHIDCIDEESDANDCISQSASRNECEKPGSPINNATLDWLETETSRQYYQLNYTTENIDKRLPEPEIEPNQKLRKNCDIEMEKVKVKYSFDLNLFNKYVCSSLRYIILYFHEAIKLQNIVPNLLDSVE